MRRLAEGDLQLWYSRDPGEPTTVELLRQHVPPDAARPLLAAFDGVDRRLLEASDVLGKGPLTTLRRVVLPLSRAGLATAAVLTFAHTVGEFGVVLMIGGNIPGVTRVASIAVYDSVESLDYAAAHRLSAVLLVLAYYECPMLCDLVLNGLAQSLARVGFVPGRDYDAVTISIEAGSTAGWQGLVDLAIGIDEFGTCGPGGEVMASYGFTAEPEVERSYCSVP